MSDEDEAILMSLTDTALHVSGSYLDLIQDGSALENVKRQAHAAASGYVLAHQTYRLCERLQEKGLIP